MDRSRRIRRRGGLAALALFAVAAGPVAAQFVRSEDVVRARAYASVNAVRPGDHFRIAIVLTIDSAWHVNSATPSGEALIPTEVSLEPLAGFRFDEPEYPAGTTTRFAFAETPVSVYHGEVTVFFDAAADESLTPGGRVLKGAVSFQPCDEDSCLAPATVSFELPITVVKADTHVGSVHPEVFGSAPATGASPGEGPPAQGGFAGAFARAGLVGGLGLAFLIGLGLNLTPCVYPLISVTVSFFGGQAADRKASVMWLAGFYGLGIVLSYSVLGTIAAATHQLFGFLLQNTIVLVVIALLLAALAASMWGLFEMPTPAFISRAGQSKRGLAGAFLMGLTMGLVSAPCIGPFIVGLLAYVAQIGSLALGFFLFFAMSLGLAVPYLVIAGFSGSIDRLPRSGMWMVWVKKIFAVILLGVAVYFIKPLIGREAFHITLAALAVGAAVYLGLVYRVPRASPGLRWARAAFTVVALAGGAYFAHAAWPKAAIQWKPYSSAALQQAQDAGRPVMLYFTADWCLPCDELKSRTFSDPTVRAEAERFARLEVDLTHGTPEVARAYGVAGPPTVVFLKGSGAEQKDARLEGFTRPSDFLDAMRRVDH